MKELLTEELLLRYVPGNVYARPYLAFVVEDREGSDAVAASEDHVIDLGAPDLAGRESPRMGADGLRLGPAVQELVALPADKLLRRRVELPRQHLVYLDYPVLAVVDGNEVLDGVEGGPPLLLALYDEFEELGVLLRPLFERIEHAVEGRRQVSYLVLGIDLNPLVDAGLAVGYPLYDLDVSPYGACDGPLYEDREQYPAY